MIKMNKNRKKEKKKAQIKTKLKTKRTPKAWLLPARAGGFAAFPRAAWEIRGEKKQLFLGTSQPVKAPAGPLVLLKHHFPP